MRNSRLAKAKFGGKKAAPFAKRKTIGSQANSGTQSRAKKQAAKRKPK